MSKLFFVFALIVPFAAANAQIDVTASSTTAVHLADGQGVVVGSADYYGSGNDDRFAEFGLATFNVSNADVASIEGVTLNLTTNDRSFSDGSQVEFFFTPDSAAALGGDFAALSYDPAIDNGLNVAQFVTAPVSLGVFPYDPAAEGGVVQSFDFDLSSAGPAMLSAVQSGSDFQILITATGPNDDVTFSGVGNTFDPGDPALSIRATIVPEPASISLLAFGVLGMLSLRRRS